MILKHLQHLTTQNTQAKTKGPKLGTILNTNEGPTDDQ